MAAPVETNTGPLVRPPLERPRVPLVWKLFVATALVVVVVVGIAIAITIDRKNRVAEATVNKSIAGAADLFKELEQHRLARLGLPIQLLGYDASFHAYVEDALFDPQADGSTAIDLVSINDQLSQRREMFGSDVLMLMDDEGRLITRSDQPSVTAPAGDDLYELTPLVRDLVDDAGLEATDGVVVIGERLYHAAVAPVGVGQPRRVVAYLLNASAIDQRFANRIADSTNADVMFVPAGVPESIARSSQAPSFGLRQMEGVERILTSGQPLPPRTQLIGGASYLLTGLPLAADDQVTGAAVFLRSLDRELAPFREIERGLLLGGGAALLVAFILSWLIAKRMTRPIEGLARMAQDVTAGDYSVQPEVERNDEVGILSRSFAKMISSLRDKAELEELYAQMSAKEAERESSPRPSRAPMSDEGTILVTDIRGLSIGQSDPDAVIAALARIMRLQESEILRQEGEVREVVGHRLVSVFRGSRGIIHAIRAARAINEELSAQADPGAPVAIGAGIATGDFVSGSLSLSTESGTAIIGNAPLLAMLFAWHAPSGHAYISYETAQAAGSEVAAAATREEVRLKWIPQPLPVAALPLAGVTTGTMRGDVATGAMATMRLGDTMASTAPKTPAALDLAQGHLFAGRYRIDQILGRGGMGVVYKATDTQLDEPVAIKTLPGDVMQRSPEDLERFKREIRLARKITHRNVLRTYDYGEADGVYFISMEFVRGYTLSELQQETSQLAPRAAMGISRQICRGLQAAHEQGIIHRDIKPQNVLIDSKGEVKLMDFGIARVAESPEAMTQAGLIVGTPHYMSPEQVQGHTLDARSDVYSMGVLMYEMLGGRRPFDSSSLTGVLAAHMTEKPKPLIEIRPEVGQQIHEIVMRCLAKDPKQRYADAGALLGDLDRVQAPAAAAA
ncbi:MAG TPA: protein kinase [Thermoanaerobaculia bacterium]|nr:protein kinase [Thermoanaerobaculia bacterium]